MNSAKNLLTLMVLISLSAMIGCTDEAPSDLPAPGLGGVTINKYMAVGNSLAAGYQSSGLYKSAQLYSYPKLISDQLKLAGAKLGTFEQPYWPDPGNPDPKTGKAARYVIISLADPNNPVIGPKGESVTAAAPENALTLPRPYDNLGLPGAPLAGFMDTLGTYQGGFGPAIIRAAGGLPKSQFLSVKALQPQLVTFWLGNNDVLGYATSGGTSPSAPTPLATFSFLFNQAIDTLKKSVPNVKIMVGTIPNVTTIPFFTTIGPKVAASLAVVGASMYYQKAGETGVGSGSTKFNNPAGDPMICLTGSAYAGYIGAGAGMPNVQGGKFYRDVAASAGAPVSAVIPAGVDTTKPFGLHPQNPWPNALVLDSSEIAKATKAVSDFNASIKSIAAAHGAVVVDFNAMFTDIAANGITISGVKYTSAYITGGLFSLDGVHPSSRGAGVIANEVIRVMNSSFKTNVTGVDISKLPALPIPLGKYMAGDNMIPNVAPQSWGHFLGLWQN
ncbi:MAG: SGNH/GDSL hydrolase family protein [Bacteroidetes bacterium]|nr:SGNH/GDSL hydrolase family protein [Bacteroidota bacterium]